MKKRNANYWWWYSNSFPSKNGIHFTFTTVNFARRFMRKFSTMPFELCEQIVWDENYVTTYYKIIGYTIKILNQDKPTEKQFTWLKRCKIDKKEKPITFEEFKRGYKFWEGKKDDKGRTVWYVASIDCENGYNYYTAGLDEYAAIWMLKQTHESKLDRGEL